MKRIHVVHLTSVHSACDLRILKECKSLAAAGYQVTLIAPHPCDEVIDGVQVKGVPIVEGRLRRMTLTVWRVYREAVRQRANIYHFHDPELIPAGLLLKARGKKVVYDAHEAYPQKILCKSWIPVKLRPIVSRLFAVVEHFASVSLDHVIVADRWTAATLPGRHITAVANYPTLAPMPHEEPEPASQSDKLTLIYAGGLDDDRGLQVMLEIAKIVTDRGIELHLLGEFAKPEDERHTRELPNVRYFGFQPLEELYRHMRSADLGLVLLQPVPAYSYAGENTNKLFEYMLCGLPVIASNFSNLRQIIKRARCGVCVDPKRPDQAARAILHLLGRAQLRKQLGENGRNAVLKTYNWEAEENKLLNVYKSLVDGSSSAPLRSVPECGD
jgi:glycosyltransferase involved in cell wall biosynthesis